MFCCIYLFAFVESRAPGSPGKCAQFHVSGKCPGSSQNNTLIPHTFRIIFFRWCREVAEKWEQKKGAGKPGEV